MTMIVRQGRLASAIAGMLLGMTAPQVTGSMERGAVASGEILRNLPVVLATPSSAEAMEAFRPDSCTGVVPPAELLALAAWPLDINGSGCDVASSVVFEPAVVESKYAERYVHPSTRRISQAPSRKAASNDRGIVVSVLSGFTQAEVEVVERSWLRREAAVAEGLVQINPVPEPDVPVTLAQVVERGWDRDGNRATAPSCETLQAGSIEAGRCVVRATELVSLDVDEVASDNLERDTRPLIIAGATTVGDDVMDGMRGGFTTPDGLVLSFGIERVVYINGELASSTRLNVSELGNLVGGSADLRAMVPVGATIGLIQSGPNNTFNGGVMHSGSFATVIQNSLDGQHIQTITTIDAQVNSMDLMQSNRFGESLRDALTFGR